MAGGFFHSPIAFGFCFTLFLVFQVTVGVYIAGTLTTLEKQYRLKSSVSGVILSVSDFASLVSIAAVTYLGQHSNRPRIIGILGLITGLGGILSGLPHFMYPAYRDGEVAPGPGAQNSSSGSPIFVCDASREEQTCSQDDIDNSGSRITEMWALILGQALMGFAYGPIFPLAISYLDDQVRGTTTPYYIGVFLSAGTTAPLIGFLQGFGFLQQFVNWPEPYDFMREWIGAWWIGFLLDGVLIALVSFPFFFFPKNMDIEVDEKDVPEEKKMINEKQEFSQVGVKDFLQSSKRIFTNFVYVIISIGTIAELAIGAIFGFFMAKFLEVQYSIPASFSALLVGIIIMPAALIGNLSSGIIVKRLNLDARGCARFLVFLSIVATAFTAIVYFLSCPDAKYSGLSDGVVSPLNSCNNNCTCSRARYEPVCGIDGLSYPSPCFAGCTGERQNQTDDPKTNVTVYTGCKCSSGGEQTEWAQQARKGECREPCNMIYAVGVVLFFSVLVGSCNKNPLLIIQMRCVDDCDKTFGLGVTSLFGRALGFLPAPLYIGAAIQSTCMLERIECGITGDCLIYNAQQFRLNFLSILLGINLFTVICYILALVKTTMKANKLDRERKRDDEIKNGINANGFEEAVNKGYEENEVGTQTYITAF